MAGEITIYLISILLFLVLLYLVNSIWFRGKRSTYLKLFFAMGLICSVWSLTNGTNVLLGEDVYVKIYPINMMFICVIPSIMLRYMLYFTESKYAPSRVIKWVFTILPAIDSLFMVTNFWHHGIISSYDGLRPQTGPLFIIHALIAYVPIAISMVVLFKYVFKNFRKTPPLIYVGIAMLLPLISNVLYTFNFVKSNFDLTPFTFLIMFLVFAAYSIHIRLFDIKETVVTSLFDSLSDAFLVVDNAGYVTDANPSFKNTFSKLLPETSQISANDVVRQLESITSERSPANIFETILDSSQDIHNAEITVSDGSTLRNYALAKDIIKERGQYAGYILTLADISNYRRMISEIHDQNNKLIELKDIAESASQARGEFLSRMSHEIRTPMNAIKGLAELLALTELNNIQDSYVRNIVKSSNSLLSIINDVLDFSKINENKIEFVEGHYLLEDLIAEVSNVVSLRASEKGLILLMDISPSLPKGLIGDEVRVKQVIINILNNAVKYTPEGHVILRLFGEETSKGFELICAVEDTGIGIRAEDIPFLFEAFSQADRRLNHNIQGTGLGLSISDRLIRGMGGSITVESEYNKGSVFTARFPQRIGSREPLVTVENPEQKHVLLLERDVRVRCAAHALSELGVAYTAFAAEEDMSRLAGLNFTHCIFDDSFSESGIRNLREEKPDCVFIALKDLRYAMGQSELHDVVLFTPLLVTELVKALAMVPGQHEQESSVGKAIDDFALVDTHVLVVDDNEINLIVSGEILRAYKADVTCVESGRLALELCAEKQFDLIFMDHMMPEMDGVETTIAIREGDSLNKSTPIIALTANVVNDMADYYLKSGMDDFIGKPIEIENLRCVLLKWLPGDKITAIEAALQPEASVSDQTKNSMERLIQSLDDFGMYVSDVMREIGNNYKIYIHRMDRVCAELAPLVARLRDEVRMENWDAFASGIGELGSMIHDVGARDCSGRARKLSNAARERNADYIRGDFFSLMDNMYMLEKKMKVAVPLALGDIGPDVPFGDLNYCYDRLKDMQSALSNQDHETSAALLDSLAHYSLDHELDLILVDIGAKLSAHDFAGAADLHAGALAHCAKLLNGQDMQPE